MKKILLTLFTLALTICSIGLVACGPTEFSVNYYDGTQIVHTLKAKVNEDYTADYDYEKLGYTFNGWTLEDGTIYTTDKLTKDLNLYADLTANPYTITYDVNGGNALSSNTQDVVFDEQVTLAVPTANFMVFDGWYYGEQLVQDGAWSIAENATLVAKWSMDPAIFTVDAEGSVITGVVAGADTLETMVIPETINGVTITKLGENAFKDFTSLKSVSIPSTITAFGLHVFEGCSSLTSIDLSNTKLTYVVNYAFKNCTSLKTVILPNTIETIYAYAFEGCSSLVTFTLPDSVVSIKGSAFYECSNLTYFDISDNSQLTELGSWTFYNCSKLTNFTLPVGLTSVGSSAFSNCEKLTEIRDLSTEQWTLKSDFLNSVSAYWVKNTYTLTSGEQKLSMDNNGFIIYDGSLIGYAGEEVNVVVPDTVNKIGKRAFYKNENIKNITIPNTVTELEDEAICYMPNLITITVPSSVKTCNTSAIHSCPRLFEVYWLADSRLYDKLWNPTGLNDNKFPPIVHYNEGEASKLVYIGDFITYSYERMVQSGNQQNVEVRNVLLTYLGNDKNITIPDGITHIHEDAFRNNTTLESVVFSDTVDYIGRGAFAGCTSLSSVTLSNLNSYKGLGEGSFSGCTSLVSIYLPESIAAIGDSCFSGCTSLATINLENIRTINKYAFQNCKALTEVSFVHGALNQIKDYAFKGCSGLTAINYSGTTTEWKTLKNSFEYYWNSTISLIPVVCSNGTAK